MCDSRWQTGSLLKWIVNINPIMNLNHQKKVRYILWAFFLLKHEVAYPKDNVLTFYSLYRHTAKLSDYKSGIEEIVGSTKSSDNKIVIRDAKKSAT